MGNDFDAAVREQVAYYRARAAEHDRVYPERDDLRVLLPEIDRLPVTGDVRDLAAWGWRPRVRPVGTDSSREPPNPADTPPRGCARETGPWAANR